MNTAETVTLNWSPGEAGAQSLGDISGPPAKAAELVVPQRLGTVRLVRELGRGGMGLVWLGHHEFLDRPVAVKFLLRAAVEREDPRYQAFLDGARAASNVRHLAISSVLHADLVNGVPYLVMEYISGPTVAEIVERAGPLRPAAVLAILERIADAVGTLHDGGVLHRDIKPSNILIDSAGQAFLTDFGLAIRVGAESPFSACGTPMYMAPEVFEGQATVRTDVYALAVTAYHMLVGQPPQGATIAEMRRLHKEGVIDRAALRVAGVSTALVDVLARASAPEVIHRMKSARKFLEGFREALGSGGAAGIGGVGGGLDQLAKLVEQISSATAGERPVEPSKPGSTATKLLLEASVPCDPCGYDLRGLPLSGECPECRTPVSRSLRAERLVFADRAWTQRTARGLVRLSLCMAVLVVMGTLSVFLPVLTDVTSLLPPITFALAALVATAAYLAAARAEPALVGSDTVRSVEDPVAEKEKSGRVSAPARWIPLAAAAAAMISLGGSIFWAFSRSGMALMPAWPAFLAFASFAAAALILTPDWAMRLSRALRRAPEFGPHRLAGAAVILFAVLCGITLVVGVLPPIAAIKREESPADAMRDGVIVAFAGALPVGAVALALLARTWSRIAARAVARPQLPAAIESSARQGSSYYDSLRTFASRRKASESGSRGGESGAEGSG